jgi:hypothetical protein
VASERRDLSGPIERRVRDSGGHRSPENSDEEIPMTHPSLHRQGDGRSQQPLLKDEGRGRLPNIFPPGDEGGQGIRPSASRRSTFRSRTPDYDAKNSTKRKYIYAAGFLVLSLISFTVQTETAVYIQHELQWDKPYCML